MRLFLVDDKKDFCTSLAKGLRLAGMHILKQLQKVEVRDLKCYQN